MNIKLTFDQAQALSCHEMAAIHSPLLPSKPIEGEVFLVHYGEKTGRVRGVGFQKIEKKFYHMVQPTYDIL